MEDDNSGGQTPSGANQPSSETTPSSGQANAPSIASVRSQNEPTPASTGSASKPAARGSRSSHPPSKRKRGLGLVTPNACTECRKKRSKCDGQLPCGRCQSQPDAECVYEIPVRQTKDNLRTELESLRSRQRTSDQIFAALAQPNLWEEVIQRLRSGDKQEAISEWLTGMQYPGADGAPVYPSLENMAFQESGGSNTSPMITDRISLPQMPPVFYDMSPPMPQHGSMQTGMGGGSGPAGSNSPWLFTSQSGSRADSNRSSSQADIMSWTPTDSRGPTMSLMGVMPDTIQSEHMSRGTPRYRGLEQVLSPLNNPELRSPPGSWTNVTDDINLVQHLLALYFCWEYPTFASLSKEHFLRDFQDGRNRYCSPILVNAMLALGCRFSTKPKTRANPHDPYTSGDHFFRESLRLFHREKDHHSLTTIQALGIMSIREASCGRDSESWYYAGQSIRLAIELGLHKTQDHGDEDETAVQSATFWGAFALDHAWSLATGSLPQCSCFPQLPPKPGIIDDIEASVWVPYTDDGAPMQRSCEQPSNVRSVYKCFCELSELVHQSLYILHSPGRPLTARDLLSIYTQYLNWYDRIPEVLRLGHNFTPAVLFAHMYYHFAILLLFRPLIKLRIIGSKIVPRDVCSQAADAMHGLLRSYSQLYTLRRTPSFVPYFVLTSAIMHLTLGVAKAPDDISHEQVQRAIRLNPRVTKAIHQGISDLAEMAPCHRFAEQALNILRYLAKRWSIEVDMDSLSTAPENLENLVKPSTSSLNFFVPNIQSSDFMCEWPAARQLSTFENNDMSQNAVRQLENPLFWPFPMQGRPILPVGSELERAGFAFIS